MAEMSPLRRRMIEDMTIRNLSPATQQSYLYAVSKFSRHFGHSPDRLGVEDVRAYLVHLTSKGFAWSSLNQTVCALRFFYGVTLAQTTVVDRIPFAREPRKLPSVLSADEVVKFLEAVSSLKARVALTTAYAAGLRVSEVAALKILRHRQPPHGAADRTRQGRQGALRHALRDPARYPARVLATGAAEAVPVSRSADRHADRAERAACRLPIGDDRGRARQACERACAAA